MSCHLSFSLNAFDLGYIFLKSLQAANSLQSSSHETTFFEECFSQSRFYGSLSLSYVLISKLHMYRLDFEPTTSTSIHYYGRRKCQLSYNSLVRFYGSLIFQNSFGVIIAYLNEVEPEHVCPFSTLFFNNDLIINLTKLPNQPFSDPANWAFHLLP